MSMPSGFGGFNTGGASTIGFTGGQFNPNTIAAVKDSAGKLTAFDPNTMTPTTADVAPKQTPLEALGYESGSPLPWQTNWLQNGGAAPGTATLTPGQVVPGQETYAPKIAGAVTPGKQKTSPMPIPPVGGKAGGVPPPTPGTKVGTGAQTGAGGYGGAPGAGTPGLTQVGGNQGQQPLYVNDQWNFQTGTSQPMATMAPGGPMANQGGQAPFWSDGKGNFFYDAQGTKPVTGPGVQQLKNMFG
jgi:hypothetical protein